MEDIIDFVNDTLKIDYSNFYNDDFKKDILDVIFNNLDLDKYKMYEETNWYKFLDKITNENEYDFDDNHINYFLGYMYNYGLYCKKDYKKAFEYYKKASEKGNHNALYNLGRMYYYGNIEQNYKKAFEYYKKASIKDNFYAIGWLGYMYETGFGCEKNHTKAFKYYKKSYKKGNYFALNNLGYMYSNGYGIEKDIKKAIKYYKKAYKKGNNKAMTKIITIINCKNINIQLYDQLDIKTKNKIIEKILNEPLKSILENSLNEPFSIIIYEAIKDEIYKYNSTDKTFITLISTKQKTLLQKLKGKNKRLSKYISLLVFNFIY